ncbi:copper homeostasis protein CutC [Paenibacillus sp. UNC451MF]|uniref:copper homeostasis protein CutC n=1 Tax=Paenibacillus sp. UNC451MF TaxID=1449063 RepID=UPI00048F94B8|nr:copper homeostasis protein CutC [Paenibacillus sp. UNC451MF]
MILEVIATSVADARLAQNNGAGRIELISGIGEGGVTPSFGLIEQVLAAVTIPVHVMVRPHANTFFYDEDDIRTMLADIRIIRSLGPAGIVVGALTPGGRVDEAAMERLLAEAKGVSVTFHRAIDEVRDQEEALRTIGKYSSISRILTSGGKPSALDSIKTIQQMNRICKELSITLLAGSGLKIESLASFISESGVTEVHLGTGVRVDSSPWKPLDPVKLHAAANIVASFSN